MYKYIWKTENNRQIPSPYLHFISLYWNCSNVYEDRYRRIFLFLYFPSSFYVSFEELLYQEYKNWKEKHNNFSLINQIFYNINLKIQYFFSHFPQFPHHLRFHPLEFLVNPFICAVFWVTGGGRERWLIFSLCGMGKWKCVAV